MNTKISDWVEHEDPLTPAERAIYDACVEGDQGVRDYAREQGWSSPGTASNLIRRARRKLAQAEEP